MAYHSIEPNNFPAPLKTYSSPSQIINRATQLVDSGIDIQQALYWFNAGIQLLNNSGYFSFPLIDDGTTNPDQSPSYINPYTAIPNFLLEDYMINYLCHLAYIQQENVNMAAQFSAEYVRAMSSIMNYRWYDQQYVATREQQLTRNVFNRYYKKLYK